MHDETNAATGGPVDCQPRGPAAMDLEELLIIDVEPVRLQSPTSNSQWPCASCGAWHKIGDGFVVRHHDAGGSRAMYVCPTCASPYVSDGAN